ncbi:MAG: hybrid sensor histidine kinase/response regulator [Magnetococcales bacterium]|nr:hybrid sensor histidine kinase/response regulator [Magnetococcales bacterium]
MHSLSSEGFVGSVERSILLIVDDERFNLTILQDLLGADYDIVVAKTGEQALQRLASEPSPDLILLDIVMPGMDGYAVLAELQGNAKTRDIPVIFVTSMDTATDESEGLRMGAVDYISKPFSPMVVQARVKTQLALQRSLRREKAQNLVLSKQNKELQELNLLKNKFLGMAAHDLRNPLSVLIGMSDLLLGDHLPKENQRDFLTSIYRTSEQMLALVNDLLDVAVIESGHFVLNKQHGRLDLLLQERLRLAQFAAQGKGSRIEQGETGEVLALFDGERLAQVMDNLLSNAVKFSPPGSRIQVDLAQEEREVVFSVLDQGPGIPESEQQRLFAHFQRLSNQPTGGEKSTGLGLAISHKIVTAHGGSIQAVCQPGGGSRFIVRLPSP